MAIFQNNDFTGQGLAACGLNFERSATRGFTLAELLIALAILGIIATFAIPKVLQSQQDARLKAVAKEDIAAISGALSTYRLQNSVDASTTLESTRAYMNYVSLDTTATQYGGYMYPCNTAGIRCLKMHNGSILQYDSTEGFGGTTNTWFVWVDVDPDGTGPGDGMEFFVYVNGRISTRDGCAPGSQSSDWSSLVCPNSGHDPSWFNWN